MYFSFFSLFSRRSKKEERGQRGPQRVANAEMMKSFLFSEDIPGYQERAFNLKKKKRAKETLVRRAGAPRLSKQE